MTVVFGFKLRPRFEQVRALRNGLRQRLEPLGVAESDVDRLVLVVDEMVSNAIEHGERYRRPDDLLTVRFAVDSQHVDLDFLDPAVPSDTVGQILVLLQQCRSGRPPLDNERGRGLYLIDDGLDSLDVALEPLGVGLRVRGRLLRTPT
ncbi:MAG: ATP-binding protein [Planctomycetes bacterium]|nr:ATP-binding protein [Planctomycetota bacterium]